MAVMLGMFVLVGCTTTEKQVYITKQIPTVQITPPAQTRPVKIRKIKIKIYDREKLETALADPEFRRIIGISESDYKAMINNYEEAIRYIETQAAVINYYERVFKELQTREIIKNEPV